MKLNFYSKATLTLNLLGKSLVCSLIAAFLLVQNAQAQGAKALNFDGTNDYVSIPVKPALNITQQITISAWINPSSDATGTQDVISKSTATTNNGYVFPRTISGWSTLEFLVNINGVGWKTLRVLYGANKKGSWHHVAATYDGYTMRIFVDGVQTGTYAFAGSISVNNNPLVIGNQTGFTEYYNGSVDDIRIYNRALSGCEIAAGMNCELAGNENGLVAYYKLNQGLLGLPNPLETTVQDSSPTGANGTLMNFGLAGTGLLSNWSDGAPAVSSTVCPAFVPTTVTASATSLLVPISGNIELFATSIPGATYAWTGPNGYNSTEQNPVLEGVGTNASGTYTVTATLNGCSGTSSIVVTVAPRASGLNFDGVNDYVTVPNHPSLNSKVFSVEAWIYPTGGNTPVQNVVSKANADANTGWKFPKTNDKWSTFTFELSVDRQWQALSANIPQGALNQWNHVAATFDGYFMRIYLNGVLVNSLEVTGEYTPSDKQMTIGNNEGRVEYFKGTVDELRFWSRAISQCEIINNMATCELNGDNNGLSRQVGLGAYYRFNQGLINVNNIVNTAADSSGNGLNGTLTNFALTGSESNWVDGKVNGLCDYFVLPTLAASANGSVFQVGSTAKLFAVNGNNDIYTWDGPNGYSSSTQNPVFANVQIPQSGTYTVTTPYVNCVVTASTRIKVTNLPQIIADGPTTFCPSGSVKLTSASTGTTYQWYRNDVLIAGATADSYVTSQTGTYTVVTTNGSDVTISAGLQVTVTPDVLAPVPDVATLPTINVTAPATVTPAAPTATDACAGLITGTTVSATTFTRSGTYTIVWTYNDGNGNTATQNQTVEVARGADVTPPVLTLPGNISVNNTTGICGAIVNFAVTATDETSTSTTITYSQNPGTQFPVGTTTVTVSATDEAGNMATGTFTVTVTDTQVPVITAPANISASNGNNINIGTATATDNCGTPVITHSNVPATFPMGTTTITWTATDASGNTATANQTVTITDGVPPVLVGVPANTTANCGVIPAAPVVTATDNSGETPAVTMTTVTSGNTVTRTWTATDAAGNTTSASQVITVIPDTQAPVLTVPADINSTTGTGINIGNATATDNCSGVVNITHSTVPANFPLGTTTITWTATDAAGNVSTKNQLVIVTDVTAPVLAGVPANTTANCGILPTVPVVTATDDFDAHPTVTYTSVTSGNTVTRTWTAKDASGNTSSASQVITLVAASAPVIAGPTSGSTVTMNPLAAALDFNVFVQNGMTISSGQASGPVAMGGDFTVAGDYAVSNNSAGTYTVSGVPVTLLIGGKVNYQSGNNVNINQNGYVKIGNSTNSYVWYKDQNNAYSPIRITPGSNYNGSPRLNLQANSQQLNVSATNNPVFQANLVDFGAAFTTLKSAATSMSAMADNANITNPNGGVIAHTGLPTQVKINLATGVNVLNLTGSDLNAVQNFTYNNQPDATHILVINVNAPGNFAWNVWNSGGIGDQNTKYIIYNFYNATALTVQGNGSVMGTLFAPNATINKSGSQNITGQVVGQSFTQASGTNTYNTFAGTITSGTTTTIAAGSNVTRSTNNASCTYTVNGSEFNATATASDNCGVLTLGYTLTGATTGSGTSLANVNLNVGTTTVTWTATNGSATSTYSFTVTVAGSTPATPVVTVADNCGTSTLTASGTTGSVLWSNGATTSSITVNNSGTYSVTQNVNGCVSTAGSASAAPKAIPAAPVVTVADNCGTSVLTASATTGSILWSNGATTASVTASNAGTYTVTQTVNGCVSAAATAVAAPKAVPSAPVVTVVDNCGSSTLTASNLTGSVLWSNGATTASITVSNAGTYTVTQTVNGCVSAAGSGVAAPKATQATPVITVTNNCGSTVLSTNAAGTLAWSNGATGSSIMVNTAGGYSVTATNASGCSATSAVSNITIKSNPVVAAIAGPNTVAANATIQLTDATTGGVWSSNNGNATVNASGVVTGVSAGTAVISYTVTNAGGCATTVSTTITVTPAVPVCTAPVIAAIQNVNVNSCNNASAAYVVNVSGTNPTITYTFSGATTASGNGNGSGATFNVGVTNVTVRAQNSCGTASQSFTVTVKSTTAPVPTVATLPTITGQCSAGLTAVTIPVVNNNSCDDDCRCCRVVCHCRTNSCNCRSYSNFRSLIYYLLSYYFGGDDNHDCDNDDSGSNNGGGSTAGTAPTAKDACTGAVITGTTTDPLSYNAQGTYTIHWKYVDARGNVTMQDQTVVVNDTQAPTPTVSNLATVSGTCSVTVTSRPTATDNCAGTITGTTTDPLTYSTQGTYTIHWTYDDGNGNTSTQNQTVVVKDVTAPVPQVSNLPTISGSCGLTVTSAPKANDACAGVIVGTTTDPLTYSSKGTYTIRWTYNDGNGNVSTQNQTVNITGGPVASIAAVAGNDVCTDMVLTASTNTSGASYKWMLGNSVVGSSSQFTLGQGSAEGTYSVYVTANGCTSSAATYTYSKQNVLSSYTILATKSAIFGKYSKVASGSVGVTAYNGSAQFKGSTAVNGDGAFVKAANINKTYSDNISKVVYGAASVTGIPAMQYNTSNANGYSNYTTGSYSTITLNGNYRTLTVRAGTYVTLTGTVFGTIDLQEGASVRFTNSTVNIDKLLVEDGARDGYYSYVRFAPNSSIRVSTQVSIGSQVLVNPDNYNVTFFMGDKSCDAERFTVSGADTKVIANIIMPNGKLFVTSTDANDDNHGNCGHSSHSYYNCPHRGHNHVACDHRSHNASDCEDDVYMTGTFVVESVESKGNTVIWNNTQCGSASVPVVVINKTSAPAAVGTVTTTKSESTSTEVATSAEELKITVMPNPSTTFFTLKFESKYETPVNMRVMDASGRVVDAQTKIGSNSTIRVGANYTSGTYFAEFTQGATRKVIQLIKVRG